MYGQDSLPLPYSVLFIQIKTVISENANGGGTSWGRSRLPGHAVTKALDHRQDCRRDTGLTEEGLGTGERRGN